jgi:hypothetical protein
MYIESVFGKFEGKQEKYELTEEKSSEENIAEEN